MDSEIILGPNGVITFSGPDAVALYRALTLRNHLALYRKAKLIPCRGMGIRKMLALATSITGNQYKLSQIHEAEADLTVWIETMRSALPDRYTV